MANQDIRNWLQPGFSRDGPIEAPPPKRQRAEEDVEGDAEEDAEEETNALIYVWTLDRIDPDHPLFDTCYFGQVVRKGLTHDKAFHKRVGQHISDATREPKDLGLHWAITNFGEEAFSRKILMKERLPRYQAMDWANEWERALIREHGGVMRDCEPNTRIRQTFNLTPGGQGDPRKRWDGMQVASRKKLMKVWPKFKAYYEEHRHLRVPFSDPDLGMLVSTIRSQKCFLWHADFKAWLDAHGFVYDARAWHLEEEVWPRLKAYYEEHRHLRVPYSDPDLGITVQDIRSKKNFLWHADFREWLDAHGFVYDAHAWHLEEEVWPKFKAYYEEHRHLRVPRSDPDLGRTVDRIRSQKNFLWHADFKEWLDAHGFVYDTRAWHLEEEVWPKFKAYYEKHKHLRVPTSDPDLGKLVGNIRSQKSFLWHADFKEWLDAHGFVYDARAWHLEEEVWPKFKAYYEKHKHLRVPHSDPDLGRTVDRIRSHKNFLWHADFKNWLWERGFKLYVRNERKNAERWAEVS